MKLTVKACLILHAKSIEILNQDSRPLLDLFRHYESNSGRRIRKRAFVENYVFQGKNYCLNLGEISVTWYQVLCFGNKAYLWTSVDA